MGEGGGGWERWEGGSRRKGEAARERERGGGIQGGPGRARERQRGRGRKGEAEREGASVCGLGFR